MPVTTPTIAGGATRSILLNENLLSAGFVAGSDLDGDALIYSIVGGADKAKFTINATTGELRFITAPDFETPVDSLKTAGGLTNGSNTYEVIVQVQDGPSGVAGTLKSLTQTITVSIGDVPGITINGTANNDTLGPSGTTSEADTLNGFAGNDILDGGKGADIMNGGLGDDTYYVDHVSDLANENAGEGTDTVIASVSYTLGANVENLTLAGAAAINATGNVLNNVLIGNTAANILDGGAGNDTLTGGVGNDVYIVDSALDVATELDGQGTDRVESTVSWTLNNFVENLTLKGLAAINGTGNALANTIVGNAAANVLTGNEGNDWLDGGKGADTLVGGIGNDTYIVDNTGDIVTELLGGGTDSVTSSVTYTLSANVENLTLSGLGAINGTGNDLNNIITGNAGANVLTGGAGNDTLKGGAGIDTMIGGTGSDFYYVDSASEIVMENVGEGNDTVISTGDGTILWSNVENLTLSGSALVGTGNDLNNVITGTSGANTLIGLAGNDTLNGLSGADTLVGGLGNDIYVVDNAGDIVTENAGEGTDLVQSSVTIGSLWANVENVTLTGLTAINAVGNALNNVMTGNTASNILTGDLGNDTLDGGRGNDTLIGGQGNDVYYINDVNTVNGVANVWDVITENANEGTDTVYSTLQSVAYTLADNVDNLILNNAAGTFVGNVNGNGNALANVITGNQGWNVIDGGAGNDTINGGAGADTIIGGAGLDTLTGGADIDTFVFKAVTDSGSTAVTADIITDFQAGEIIDLLAIDARADLTGDQAFVLDTNGTLTQGEILMTRSGNVITLSIDTDAVAGANMVLQITVDASIPTGVLTIDNFVL